MNNFHDDKMKGNFIINNKWKESHLLLEDQIIMSSYSNTRILQKCADLAQASDYNLFILSNVEQRNSDIEGRAAIGGNAVFSSFGVGSRLCNTPAIPCPAYGTDPTLVVGGGLTWDNGSNFSGNTVMTPTGDYNVTGVSYNNADISLQPIRTKDLPVDFQAAFAYYRCASLQWALEFNPPNTTIVINCLGNVFLIGRNEDINAFHIREQRVAPIRNVVGAGNNTFNALSSLTIIAPDSSTILISVDGETVNFGDYAILRSTNVPAKLPAPSTTTCNQLGQGITPTDEQKRRILWNFYNAETIVTSNTSFQGSVLAPHATIYTTGGNIEGNVIAESYLPNGSDTNHTEIHNYLFNGCLPEVICITTSSTTSTSSSTTSSSTSSSSNTSSSTTSSSTTSSSTTSSSTTSSSTTSSSTTSSSTTLSSTASSSTNSSYTTSSSTTSCTSSTTTTCPLHCCKCPFCCCNMEVWKRNGKIFYGCPCCGYCYVESEGC